MHGYSSVSATSCLSQLDGLARILSAAGYLVLISAARTSLCFCVTPYILFILRFVNTLIDAQGKGFHLDGIKCMLNELDVAKADAYPEDKWRILQKVASSGFGRINARIQRAVVASTLRRLEWILSN